MRSLVAEYAKQTVAHTVVLLAGGIGVLSWAIAIILVLSSNQDSANTLAWIGVALFALALVMGQFLAWLDMRRDRDQVRDELAALKGQLDVKQARERQLEMLGFELQLGQWFLDDITTAGQEYQKAISEMQAAGQLDEERFRNLHEKVREESDKWEGGTEKTLDRCGGQSLVALFGSDQGLTAAAPPPELVNDYCIERWQHHEKRLQRLHLIIVELQRRWL